MAIDKRHPSFQSSWTTSSQVRLPARFFGKLKRSPGRPGLEVGFPVANRRGTQGRLTTKFGKTTMPTEQSASFNVDYHLGRFHRVSSRYGQAIQLHHRALMDLRESLGPDHPETLRSSTALANSFYAAGHYPEAIALFEDTLERRARTLGPEHPDTLRSRGSLGNCFHATGDYETAVSMHEQTLALREKVLGHDHPSTRASRNNLDRARKALEENK